VRCHLAPYLIGREVRWLEREAHLSLLCRLQIKNWWVSTFTGFHIFQTSTGKFYITFIFTWLRLSAVRTLFMCAKYWILTVMLTRLFFWEITWLKLIKVIKFCGARYLHILFANWHSPAALTEFFPCFFLSCKANAWVHHAKRDTVRTLPN